MMAKIKEVYLCVYCGEPAETFQGKPVSSPYMCMEHMLLTSAKYWMKKIGTEISAETVTDYLINVIGIPVQIEDVKEQLARMELSSGA